MRKRPGSVVLRNDTRAAGSGLATLTGGSTCTREIARNSSVGDQISTIRPDCQERRSSTGFPLLEVRRRSQVPAPDDFGHRENAQRKARCVLGDVVVSSGTTSQRRPASGPTSVPWACRSSKQPKRIVDLRPPLAGVPRFAIFSEPACVWTPTASRSRVCGQINAGARLWVPQPKERHQRHIPREHQHPNARRGCPRTNRRGS